MVESEEKRKWLLDRIERWAKHTKVDHLLRDHDIPGLVGSILDEFYHVSLSCGHKVREYEEGVSLTYEEFVVDRSDMEHGGGMAEVSGIYCKDCAKWYTKEAEAKEVA